MQWIVQNEAIGQKIALDIHSFEKKKHFLCLSLRLTFQKIEYIENEGPFQF